jgi:predicted nucleic acid-binding protein
MGEVRVNLPSVLKGRRGVVLDTMVFIYLFEDHPRLGAVCEALLEEAAKGFFSGAVTPIAAAELLVKPLKARQVEIAERYRRVLRYMTNIIPCEFTLETGFLAGALRAKYKMPLPDMMQAAAALRTGSKTLITNDRDLLRVEEIRVLILDDLAA